VTPGRKDLPPEATEESRVRLHLARELAAGCPAAWDLECRLNDRSMRWEMGPAARCGAGAKTYNACRQAMRIER
jgi:hypothetical protein